MILMNKDVQYKVTKVKDSYSLVTHGAEWTKQGFKTASLRNTGNSYIFNDHFSKKTFTFDYSQLNELLILLQLHNENVSYKLYKEVTNESK